MGTLERTAAASGARRRATARGHSGRPDVVGLYLDDVRGHPLLSPEDEVRLAQAIEAGRAASEALEAEGALSDAERDELDRLVHVAEQARTEFIDANLRLVVSIAKRYARPGVPLADLVQEGNVGLMIAVDRWEWRRGWRFATYATWWVRNAVIRAVDSSSRTLRVPAHVSERAWKVRRIANEHLVATGSTLSRRELADAAGTTVADVELVSRAVRAPVSLSVTVDDDGTELADILAAQGDASPEDEASTAVFGDEVEALLGALRPREREIIRALFGIGEPPQSRDEVASAQGITRERVRQIEARAMARLRKSAKARGTRSVLSA